MRPRCTLIAALVLLLTLTAHAQIICPPILTPVRPTPEDVNATLPGGNEYVFFRGCTATQTERDAMAETLVGLWIPEAIRYARGRSSCDGDLQSAEQGVWGFYNEILDVFGSEYEQRGLVTSRGTWTIERNGHYYEKEISALRVIRDCSRCAASPLLTPGLARVLGCTTTAPSSPRESFNDARAQQGVIQSLTRMPPLTTADLALLRATHVAHHAVTESICGGPQPSGGIVQTAHLAYEAAATTEAVRHFRRMKDFGPFMDERWTAMQRCRWARLEDRYHEDWMNAQISGDWGLSRQAETDHQQAHICASLRHPNLRVRFSCVGDTHACLIQSCVAALDGLMPTLPPNPTTTTPPTTVPGTPTTTIRSTTTTPPTTLVRRPVCAAADTSCGSCGNGACKQTMPRGGLLCTFQSCGATCTSDADCPTGQFCVGTGLCCAPCF